MTKAEFTALQNETRLLAMHIGLRSASRAMGLSEVRVRNWSSRQKWGIATLPIRRIPANDASLTRCDTTALEATQRILAHHSDRTKLGFAIAGTNAAETLADKAGNQLLSPATAIAADQWAKVANVTHGWTQERQQGVTVNVAAVTMPSAEEQAQRRAMHAKLDDIARKLGNG